MNRRCSANLQPLTDSPDPSGSPELVRNTGCRSNSGDPPDRRLCQTMARADVYASATAAMRWELESRRCGIRCSVRSERRAKIVFDTPLGLVDGFVSIRHLENLSEQERLQAVRDAESQDEVRSYEGNVLPRTDGYTPVERPTDTPAPTPSLEPTASSDPNATPTPEKRLSRQWSRLPRNPTEPTTKPTTEVTTGANGWADRRTDS